MTFIYGLGIGAVAGGAVVFIYYAFIKAKVSTVVTLAADAKKVV